MFKGLGNIAEVLRNAGRLRDQMEQMAAEQAKLQFEGEAGGGMVRVRINGKQEVLACSIDPKALTDGDLEFVEDLVVAATNQAMVKARDAAAQQIEQLSGGLNIPGIMDMLGGAGPKT